MPAGVRGGSLAQAGPRPKASSKSQGARPRRPRAVEYAPAKLNATQAVGVSPKFAGIVAAVLVAGCAIAALATGGRWHALTSGVAAGLDWQAADLGFKVKTVHVEGASPLAQADILAATGLRQDQPILGLDLNALRARIEHVGWVKEATVVRLLPDTLVIAVKEHATQAVWQHNGRLQVIDSDGRPITEADPASFPSLPLVVGEGANASAADILPLLKSRPKLLERLDAAVRVDDRRWDLRLKDGSIIQLPAIDPDAALIRLDQLDRNQRITELGFERIDLREPDLISVRPRASLAAAKPAAAATSAAAPGQPAAAPPVTTTLAAAVQPSPAATTPATAGQRE